MVNFEQWKKEEEISIRRDAIQKSQSVTVGKITEHFIPFFPEFDYNPKDARFIGSPIDFLIFDGLNEGEVKQIIFAEVKTGTSSLSTKERHVRDAVQNRRVRWVEITVNLDSYDKSELQFEIHDKSIPKASLPTSASLQKVTSFDDGRISSGSLDKCPHGIPKIKKCAICDPEGWRMENGE